MVWLLSILACDDEAAPPHHVTPWAYAEPAGETAPLDAAALAASVPGVVDALLRIDPLRTHEAFLSALGAFDAVCPVAGDHNGQMYREGDCTAGSGARFYGYELQTQLSDLQLDFPGVSGFQHAFSWMTGNSRLDLPDGTSLVFGGDSLVSDRTDEAGDPRYSVYLWGSFRRDGAAAGNDWLDEDLGVEVLLESSGPREARVVTWDGGVTGLADDIVAFRLDDLTFDTGSGCASPTSGGLALYGRDARWVDVVFDASCDGCADLVRNGEVVTRACADWSRLATWTTSPWE